MENIKKLETLKQQVESLWNALQTASGQQEGVIRQAYSEAYNSYKRQLTWVKEVTLS